ncbi:hypothetical protein J31TS4_27950 [Paenibacillus sp. J31TS4]|uniref:hypothetical protein n=1 Tax=Paenibacillus sp. J31TS4 TaxID=2807195 RepID=UPI001B16D670|nr:hypothetical protein [Paenibacillus sp. J31TS4]GIP39515.1 hypothetical protein J31TS4_27950 [Paenibacillus sp. J31TS4]
MATRPISANPGSNERSARRLTIMMTVMAWLCLGIGVVLSLLNITDFNDKNLGLMVGIGFLVGSVFIFTIGTAIGLVHARLRDSQQE